MRTRVQASAIGMLVALVASVLVAVPVAAGNEESGAYGVHFLLDSNEYAGVVCHSPSGTNLVDKLTVRRPIAFASKGAGTQKVGWSYGIQSRLTDGDPNAWSPIFQSSVERANATAKHNAAFSRRSHAVTATDDTSYRIFVSIYWYGPNGTTVVGQDVEQLQTYDHILAAPSDEGIHLRTFDSCESSTAVRPAGIALPAHTGHYGAHALIDTPEYAAAKCTYHATGPDTLATIKLRAPIVYASDRVGSSGSQTVGWRYRITYNDGDISNADDWHVLATSTIVTATATSNYNAQWSARTYTVTHAFSHNAYRATVQMLWYWPSSTHRDGEATHAPEVYDQFFGTDEGNYILCGANAG